MQSYSNAIRGSFPSSKTKPVLTTRTKSVGNSILTFKIPVNRFSLDRSKKILKYKGEVVSFTEIQYRIFESIIASEGTFARYSKLESLVSGEHRRNTIKVHIHHIRKKLKDCECPLSVRVVYAEGFTLDVKDSS